MKAFQTDRFVLPLPDGHRFPMSKYRRLRERVEAPGALPSVELCVPPAATESDLLRVHDEAYWARVRGGELTAREIRAVGFPWSPAMVERSLRSTGATVAAARAALDTGVAINLAGGTHHAFRDRGEGFCVFNDAAVAARAMQAEGRAERVLVVDADVHQGNGTASIFRDDASVFTLSIHGEQNYPFRKERSDIDVALPDGTKDEAYLDALEGALNAAEKRIRPDLVIYLAGADPFAGDRFGRLALTKEGLARRDRTVIGRFRRDGVVVAVAMAGGYAPDVDDIVDIHFRTVQIAGEFDSV